MADQPDYSGSCMLAIYPPLNLAKSLALPGGLDPDGMHVTIAYTGDAVDVAPAALIAAAREITVAPFTAQISGSGRFTGGPKDVLVALIDAPELEELRRQTLDALARHGIDVPREHGFTPHCSLGYIPAESLNRVGRIAPTAFPVTAISVVHGADRTDIPLPIPDYGTFAEVALDAYRAGWAVSGGPMTDRVREGAKTAVAMACEHAGEHGILEATLKLGSLEGTWAKVYQRRDELTARHSYAAVAAWKTILTRDQVAVAVSDFRRRAGITEADEGRADQNEIKAAAIAAATALIQGLPNRPEWKALRTAIRNALAAGQAEGVVGAIAIAADRAGETGLDWDTAYADSYDALADLDTLWADTDGWLAKILGQATGELGRSLAASAKSGATYAQMLTAAVNALDSGDVKAVSFVVDWALSTGLAQGALRLYDSEGVTDTDWITAGDVRVCATCDDNEANGPYAPGQFPTCPAHPLCRCTPAASVSLANFAHWFTN
jgi:2'-5' RNA ligase